MEDASITKMADWEGSRSGDDDHNIAEAQAQESRLNRIPQEMPSETWPAHVVAALFVHIKWS